MCLADQNRELRKSQEGRSGLGSGSLLATVRMSSRELLGGAMGPTKRRVQAIPAFGGWSIVSRQHVKWDKALEFWKQGQCGRMIKFAWLTVVFFFLFFPVFASLLFSLSI